MRNDYSEFAGQVLTEEVQKNIQKTTGKKVRVAGPGDMITADYVMERVTVYVDENDTIVQVLVG